MALNEFVGKKGRNLEILSEKGFNVPKFFIVDPQAYKSFLDDISGQISVILKEEDTKISSEKIKNLILSKEFNKSTKRSIEENLNKFPENVVYAVRSSGSCNLFGEQIQEDSEKHSLAGQFDSYLNVTKEDVFTAVKLCWSSLFNERSLKLFQAQNNPQYLKNSMSVVVQELVFADKSFVVMTQDPFDNQVLGIEATYGPCEAIVSGFVTGDMYLCDRLTGDIKEFECGSKNKKAVYKRFDFDDNYSYVDVAMGLRDEACLSNKEVKDIFQISKNIEQIFKKPMDIEGVIRENEIYIVQARPVTTLGGK